MDKRGLRSLGVPYLVLGMLLFGHSTASFQSCYESCFLLCVIVDPNHSVGSCTLQCLKDCIIPSPSLLGTHDDNNNGIHKPNNNHYFCKLGCASSLCSNFSTKQNPEVEKVGSCVDSCSETCTKNI